MAPKTKGGKSSGTLTSSWADFDNPPGMNLALTVKDVIENPEDYIPKKVTVSEGKYLESAQHIKEAQSKGKPAVLTVNRKGAKKNRRESLKGVQTQKGKDRDEYPPAMFEEGGQGASVKKINPSDNSGSGSCIGAQCRNVENGEKVEIVVVE